MPLHHAKTPTLSIAYQAIGPETGTPVILLHGFPYSVHAYRDVAPVLADAGCRVYGPHIRGYGETRFLSPETMRSGEQAAIGHDVLDLMDALKIDKAVLAGFDWGGRGAAIVAALWPERVTGLLSCGGYPILDALTGADPIDPAQEYRFWYQHYFQTERGRRGLGANRQAMTRLLWQLWSPSWRFDDAELNRTTVHFDNADFVDVVIHAYRHRMGAVAGDPCYAITEAKLARQPPIKVPTIVIHGAVDGVNPCTGTEGHHRFFTGAYERRVLAAVGHNPPQEAPQDFAAAVLDLRALAA